MDEKLPDHTDHTSLAGASPGAVPEPPDAAARTVNLKHLLAAPQLPTHPDLDRILGQTPTSECGALLGDYEILSEVGRGGMGIVYKARHRSLHRVVALKVTRAGHLVSQEEACRFQAEAAAVARLDHPNIVPVYEIGESDGRQFFSMAFVEGESLADAVSRSPLPPRRAAGLLHQVAAAIGYAHAQGVIHRDLKPENILLDAAGRPRVTDFGIAKCADADSKLTQAGVIMGTPSYMPPEQAQGRMDQVGPLADVYSLGATLYCLLTGRPPFRAATPLETFEQVVWRDPVPPRLLNPAVDRDLDTICLKCLEKRPERRYASALALAEDLQRFLDGKAIQARPVRSWQKAGRWCRRNPLAAALSAGVVTVFLAAFTLVTWSYWRSEEALREEARQRAAANQARDDARRHERAERWERYRANLATVASAFQSQNTAVARRSLAAAPVEHRNWEWHHFNNLLDNSQRVLAGHQGAVRHLAFLPGDRLLADDEKLHVWDLTCGRRIRSLPDVLHTSFSQFRLSPNRHLLAYHSTDHTIHLWDLKADRQRAVLRGDGKPFMHPSFSPDGKTLISLDSDRKVWVWDAATGQPAPTWQLAEDRAGLGFSLGSRLVVVSSLKDGTPRVWDLAARRKVADLPGHESHVIGATFSPKEDRLLVSEAYPSNKCRLWDAATWKQVAVLAGHANEAHQTYFSPDGSRIATCSFDQTVRLWDGATGQLIAVLRGHTGRVMAAAFSPDSKRLVSASQDSTLRLWDATTGAPIRLLCGHAGEVFSVAYSQDGTRIGSGATDGTVRLWDARLAERDGVLRGHTEFVYDTAFLPDGKSVVSCSWDGTVRVWNPTTNQQTALLRHGDKAFVTAVAVHPSGKLLATSGRDNSVRLWDLSTGKELHRWSVPNQFWQDSRIAFSPGGDQLAAGSKDGAVYLFDVTSRAELAVLGGHKATAHNVLFGPEGKWLASSAAEPDRTVLIWDVRTKELLHTLKGHADGIYALGLSRDGKFLASGSKDGTVRFWDTATWKEVAVLKHGTAVYGVAFNPDGSRLATACADNTIRIWDVATRQEVVELRGHGSYVHAVAFSPDGSRLVSASGDHTLRVWDSWPAQKRAARD